MGDRMASHRAGTAFSASCQGTGPAVPARAGDRPFDRGRAE